MAKENFELNETKKGKKHEKSLFACNLIRFRKAHKLTQEQVADILKLKRSTYAYYERNTTPSLEIIQKLCILFNTTVEELLYGPKEYEPKNGWQGEDPNGVNQPKLSSTDLRKDETLMIAWYRLLPPHLKEKAYKEIKELYEKAE